MQERGGGVNDAFLFAPTAAIAAGGAGPVGRRAARRAGGNTAAVPVGAGRHVNNTNNNNNSTRAIRHKASVLGVRPGKKQGSAAATAGSSMPQQKKGKGAPLSSPAATRAAKVAAKAVGGGAQAQGAGKGKKAAKKGGKPAKAAPPNAGDLDSELNEYMMKDSSTAASVLDNDLDSYMADKPAENTW